MEKDKKMKKIVKLYALFLMFIFCTFCKGQTKTILPTDTSKSKGLISPYGPTSSVLTIIQDRQGNIWLASNEGIIRYDGKTFTNITGNLGSDRFFSVLQDRNENIWFGSFDGVYRYDGKTITNFKSKEDQNNMDCRQF